MRSHVTHIPTTLPPEDILDTAGTGGAPKTWNVSTAAAIIAAAAGVVVAKHGNRSRTGRGSAEALQALGVNVDAQPENTGILPPDGGDLVSVLQFTTIPQHGTLCQCEKRLVYPRFSTCWVR